MQYAYDFWLIVRCKQSKNTKNQVYSFDYRAANLAGASRMKTAEWEKKVPNLRTVGMDVRKILKCTDASNTADTACDNARILLKSRLIMLDLNTNPSQKDSFEHELLAWLRQMKYSGMMIRSNIYIDPAFRSWWSGIKEGQGVRRKHDLSEVGHSTGTGILDFEGGLELQVVDVEEEVNNIDAIDDGPEQHASGENGQVLDLAAPASYNQPAASLPSANRGVPCIFRNSSDWMLDALEFMPEWESAAKSMQHQADHDGPRLQAEIMKLQNPAASGSEHKQICSATPVVRGVWKTYGLGACLHLLHNFFTGAFVANGRVALHGRIFGRSRSKFCPSGELTCFFQPVSNCTGAMGKIVPGKKYERYFVPPAFSHRGFFWWTAQQMSFMTRLSTKFDALVRKVRRKLGYERARKSNEPVMTMQIRHGDSCVVREGCYPLALYMKHANRVKQMYGVTNIFLATDSARVIAQVCVREEVIANS